MSGYVAEVRIQLKPGVADPEGANAKKALELLGFQGVKAVKRIHAFTLELDAPSRTQAAAQVDEMCKRLLVNPVIHVPEVRWLDAAPKKAGAQRVGSRAKATRKVAAPKGRKAAGKPKAKGAAGKTTRKSRKPAGRGR